jgi:hypothetical protein
MSPFDINSVVFHFYDFNFMDNRRRTLNDIITTIFLLNVGTAPTV